MSRFIAVAAAAVLGTGCAGTRPDPVHEPYANAHLQVQEADLAVAGWRVPFECLELSERIEASQARLYEKAAGTFSTARATDERRLRSLESRADELGCLLPGSPFAY
jgi:hypothetical protein